MECIPVAFGDAGYLIIGASNDGEVPDGQLVNGQLLEWRGHKLLYFLDLRAVLMAAATACFWG